MKIQKFFILIAFLFLQTALFAQPELFLSNEGGMQNETVTVKLTAKDFTDVSKLEFSMTWSVAVLEFAGPCVTNLPLLDLGNFDLTNLGNGRLTMSWEHPLAGQSVTIADDEMILAICFRVVGDVGTSTPVNLVDNPVQVLIFNPGSTDGIAPLKTAGSVTVLPDAFLPVRLGASVEDVTPFNSQACVEITADNFEFLQNINFSLAWDPNELVFTEVRNFNLDNLDQSDFDLALRNNGRIGLNWSDLGASVPNGTVLFEACFTGIAFPGTVTPIFFEDNPTAISATHQNNRPIAVESGSGAVRMNFQPLLLMANDTTIDPQESACISLNSEYFSNITELDLTLNWDASVVTFDAAFPYGLPDFTDANLDYDNVATGVLKINYTNPRGAFFPGFENFLDLCFTATGAPGSSTDVTITNNSQVLASYSGGLNIGVEFSGGKIGISDFFAELSDIVNTTCDTKDLGSIDLRVQGGTAPYTFDWSNGESTEDLDNLSQGFYTVTVTDSSMPARSFEKTYEIILDDLNAPEAIISGNPEVDCLNTPLQLDGSQSSSGDFSYEWQTVDGQIVGDGNTAQPIVQGTGEYLFLVTDNTTGCCARAVVNVGNAAPPIAEISGNPILNCYNPQLNLNGNGSTQSSTIEYAWTTQLGSIVSGATEIDLVVDAPANYQLIVTDTETSCTDTAMVTVTDDFEYPTAEAGDITLITCDTLERILGGNATSSGTDFSYLWTTRRGYFSSDRDEQFVTVNAPGVYILSVQNNRNGCITKDSIGVFGGSDLPFIDLDSDTMINCRNPQIVLDGTRAANGPTFEHYWYTFDGNIVGGWNTMTPTIDRPGTYAYEVYNRQTNCRNIVSLNVRGDFEQPELSADFTTVDFPCNDDELSLLVTNTSLEPATYVWSALGGNLLTNFDELAARVDGAGLYTVEAQNVGNGCVADLSITVESPEFPDAEITATSILDCNNPSISLTGADLNGGDRINFFWSTIDGNIDGNVLGQSAFATEPGTYNLTLQNEDTGCRDSIGFLVERDIEEPLVVVPDTVQITCAVMEVQIDASNSSDGSDFEFEWTTAGGNFVDSMSLSATVDAPGTYTLTIRNTRNGCSTSRAVLVTENGDRPEIMLAANFDLGCSGVVELDASDSDSGDIVWTTQNGNIVSGENTLNPTVDQPGIYELTITNSATGCDQTAQTEVVLNINLPDADAGGDLNLCDISGGLSANLPTDQTGTWTVLTPGASLAATDSPTADFIDLQNGTNIFVWSLSEVGCPDYDRDTVEVFLASAPEAVDDVFDATAGTRIVVFDVFQNDIFDGTTADLDFQLVAPPTTGVLESLGDGRYRYQFAGEEEANIVFDYQICSKECPDLCDFASITLRVDGLEILNEVPNVITPNGDGLNDELYFEELASGNFPSAELLIFNRWGDEVFRSQGYRNTWNGVNNSGDALPHATYYYVLKFDAGGRQTSRGHVTVMD